MNTERAGQMPSDQQAAAASGPLEEALSFKALLVVQWTPLAELPDSSTLDLYHDENLRLLGIVSLLNEQRSSFVGSEDANTLEGEVARLHQKMNLVADLMATLISQLLPGAAPVAAQLSSLGLCWRAAAEGDLGLLSLRLHNSVPQPFVWPARRIASHDGWQQAQFEPLGEACQAALERHVFLHHRRAIAVKRRPLPKL